MQSIANISNSASEFPLVMVILIGTYFIADIVCRIKGIDGPTVRLFSTVFNFLLKMAKELRGKKRGNVELPLERPCGVAMAIIVIAILFFIIKSFTNMTGIASSIISLLMVFFGALFFITFSMINEVVISWVARLRYK